MKIQRLHATFKVQTNEIKFILKMTLLKKLTLSIPKWSNRLNCILIISFTVINGKFVPYGLLVKGFIDDGPLVNY